MIVSYINLLRIFSELSKLIHLSNQLKCHNLNVITYLFIELSLCLVFCSNLPRHVWKINGKIKLTFYCQKWIAFLHDILMLQFKWFINFLSYFYRCSNTRYSASSLLTSWCVYIPFNYVLFFRLNANVLRYLHCK